MVPAPTVGQKYPGKTASILVVDDVSANLQVLSGMLKERGYKVRPVPSGELALRAARKDPPDLILLDINMPEMNGFEVCRHLKADQALRGIPVIFISALNENLDKVNAFACGGVDYITKPFQMEELHARVETHLKLRRLQVEVEESNSRLESINGRMSRDLEAAARIQKTFLPSVTPAVSGLEFAWCYRPCDELAGDALNIIPLGGNRVGLYILDVSGHGVSAALLSVTLSRLLSPPSEPSSILIRNRENLDVTPLEVTPPAEVADRLNQLFPFDTATEQFATLLYGVLDSLDWRFPSCLRRSSRSDNPPRPRAPGDPRNPWVSDRPLGRGLLRAVGPFGGGGPVVSLLRWPHRDDELRRRGVRRYAASRSDWSRERQAAPARDREPPNRNLAMARRRQTARRYFHPGGRGGGRARTVGVARTVQAPRRKFRVTDSMQYKSSACVHVEFPVK